MPVNFTPENRDPFAENGMPPDNDPMWAALAKESIKDNFTVNRPEDPRITEAAMSRLYDAVSDFVRREYEDELDPSAFSDPSCIGIAETNAEDHEEIVIDMAVNVPNLTLDQYINGEKTDSWHYADLDALIGEIQHISFDELVSLGPNAEQRVEQLIAAQPDEHDFLRNPEDSFAIYQLKAGPEYHELRFASMSDLRRDAEQMRSDVHRLVENTEGMIFADKDAAETHFRSEGFTVLPNPDPGIITVSNSSQLTSDIYLTHGNDCCWADGCDTRPVEQTVKHAHYDLVYTGPLPATTVDSHDTMAVLEDLYARFNLDRPDDFRGHSLSVSDVIVLKQGGQVGSYYTDSFGFEKIPDFLSPYEYLRNAEMAIEDDFDMVGDGLLNNGCKQEESKTQPIVLDEDKEAVKPKAKAPKRNSPER